MSLSLFFFNYSLWHYHKGPKAIIHIWFTFLKYIEQTFAIRLHLRSLFAPWHRVQEKTENKLNFEEWASNMLVNIVSRFIGLILRLTLILMGSICAIVHILLLILWLLVWIFAPVLVVGSILAGFTLIIISYGEIV